MQSNIKIWNILDLRIWRYFFQFVVFWYNFGEVLKKTISTDRSILYFLFQRKSRQFSSQGCHNIETFKVIHKPYNRYLGVTADQGLITGTWVHPCHCSWPTELKGYGQLETNNAKINIFLLVITISDLLTCVGYLSLFAVMLGYKLATYGWRRFIKGTDS